MKINSILMLLVAIQEQKDLLKVIQYLKNELKITSIAIAEMLGISPSALYLYVNGAKIPPKKEAYMWQGLRSKFLGGN